jgi:hypothetical protein
MKEPEQLMPAQTSPNLDDLLRVLNAATDKKALNWKTTAEEDTFRAQLGAGMVRISKVLEASRYTLSLLDHEGTFLEEYQPSGEGTLIAIENLYKKARRQALNLDSKLNNFYDHLKSLAGES